MLIGTSFGLTVAEGGTLYGEITLPEDLNDDTDSGQLMLSSCSHVLLTLSDLTSAKRPRVYEARILREGKLKNIVYIELHEASVNALDLRNGTTVDVEVQFQLNRSNFVRMHEAVDAVRSSNNLPVLFPTIQASGQPGGQTLRYLFVFFHYFSNYLLPYVVFVLIALTVLVSRLTFSCKSTAVVISQDLLWRLPVLAIPGEMALRMVVC